MGKSQFPSVREEVYHMTEAQHTERVGQVASQNGGEVEAGRDVQI